MSRKPFASPFWVLAAMLAIGSPCLANRQARGADPAENRSPRALLLVADKPPRVVTNGQADHDNHDRYLQNQLVMLKTRLVLSAAMEQAAISQLPAIKNQADPTAWLARNLKVTNLNNTGVIEVSMDAQSGVDAKDQAAIINAIVGAYMEEVIDVNKKRRADRSAMLKKLWKKYQDMLHERRETARKLSEYAANSEKFAGSNQQRSARRHDDLMDRRLTLRLDRARTETLLARKPKEPRDQTEQDRKEIAQFEEHLAVLTAQEKVLQEAHEEVTRATRKSADNQLDLAELTADIAAMEDTYRKVSAEIEALNRELEAPPDVRVLEYAVAVRK
jgi:hypothetical protein